MQNLLNIHVLSRLLLVVFHVLLILLTVVSERICEIATFCVRIFDAASMLVDNLLFYDVIIWRAWVATLTAFLLNVIGRNINVFSNFDFAKRFPVIPWIFVSGILLILRIRVVFLILRLNTLDIREGISRYPTGKWLNSLAIGLDTSCNLRLSKLFTASDLAWCYILIVNKSLSF